MDFYLWFLINKVELRGPPCFILNIKIKTLSLILNQPASSVKLLRIWKLATEKRPEQPLVRLSIQGTDDHIPYIFLVIIKKCRILTFHDKKCRIPAFRDKTLLNTVLPCYCNSLVSRSLSLSNALWAVSKGPRALWAISLSRVRPELRDWLTRPLLSSERRSRVPALYATLIETTFIKNCSTHILRDANISWNSCHTTQKEAHLRCLVSSRGGGWLLCNESGKSSQTMGL